jgi:5-methylcytosine-specific restriction endonuclease McrA
MAKKKKISIKKLREITYKDVLEAIRRWDVNEDKYKNIYRPSTKYFLYYNGKKYWSKPIFAIAYEVHYKESIKVEELSGGDSGNKEKNNKSKGTVATLLKELSKQIPEGSPKFEIVTKSELDKKSNSEASEYEEKENPFETIIIHTDGKKKEYYIARYERNSENRKNAIRIHGTKCMICGFDFEKVYGEAGKGFIEVHHIKPLSEEGEEVEINPETDLICICANCHRIIHRKKDKVYTMDEVKYMINSHQTE